ncbi:MAG: lipoyl domain-containing protein [Clostridia bacterium]|nr:lipoyl domain-containing protein [Clostridia bacterium]
METEIRMPKLRPEMKKGMLADWLKEEGDTFEEGEALFEIETDKVVNQVEAQRAGRVKKLIAEEGDEVEPGAVIAVIEEI